MDLVAYVGRQALFDRQRETIGYELLFRNSDENRARFDDADQAAATTMLNAAVDLGLAQLAGDLPVWINLTERYLLGGAPIPLPPERTVLEVLETVPVTPELIASLRELKGKGFRIALDDFILTDTTRPLLAVADWIKVDVMGRTVDDVKRQYDELRTGKPPLLAEKVDTPKAYATYHAMGFDAFQGFYLEVPVVTMARRLPHDRARLVQVLRRLYDPRADVRAIEAVIAADVGLSVRLLRLAGSAAMARGAPIGSVGQAISRLGVQTVSAMVMLILATGFDDKPPELARNALIRARMCELLARSTGQPPGELFTAGLLSLVDRMLDRPLAELLRELRVTPTITMALLGDRTSAPARIVAAARHHDRGELDRVAETGLPARDVFNAWYDAIQWTQRLIALL